MDDRETAVEAETRSRTRVRPTLPPRDWTSRPVPERRDMADTPDGRDTLGALGRRSRPAHIRGEPTPPPEPTASPRSPTRRRALVAGIAAAGATAATGTTVVVRRILNDDDRDGAGRRDPAAGHRPADAGGFEDRDDSYTADVPAAEAPTQRLVYDTAGEAAAETQPAPSVLGHDPVAHLLRRTTFGSTPELVAEVESKGIDAWLDEQLNPGGIPDPTADAVWQQFPKASMTPAQIHDALEVGAWNAMTEYATATLSRQVWSQRQLLEVMVDLWSNHLNVPLPSSEAWNVGVAYHNDVIRAHALGSFRDMLLAAMRHPGMLQYLNNAESTKRSVNENLGRELLELHTVGVASGYTEDDVRNSAYILTGRTAWRLSQDRALAGTFWYDPGRHWTGAVRVLDFTHANPTAEGGLDVGDAYLGYLATHPATAHTIARKLAVRFVADSPPDSLVERLATTYLEHDTAIVPVLQVLFRSAETWAAVGQKARRPLENLTATMRTLGVTPGAATVDGLGDLLGLAARQLGHAPLGWPAPNGYPDVHPPWRSVSGLLALWNLHRRLVRGEPAGFTFPPLDQLVAGLPSGTVGEHVDSLCRRLCGMPFAGEHRAALLAFVGVPETTPVAQSPLPDLLPHLVPLVLDSPHFALR